MEWHSLHRGGTTATSNPQRDPERAGVRGGRAPPRASRRGIFSDRESTTPSARLVRRAGVSLKGNFRCIAHPGTRCWCSSPPARPHPRTRRSSRSTAPGDSTCRRRGHEARAGRRLLPLRERRLARQRTASRRTSRVISAGPDDRSHRSPAARRSWKQPAAKAAHQPTDLEGKIGAFYKAFMDEARVERLGVTRSRRISAAVRAAEHPGVRSPPLMGQPVGFQRHAVQHLPSMSI